MQEKKEIITPQIGGRLVSAAHVSRVQEKKEIITPQIGLSDASLKSESGSGVDESKLGTRTKAQDARQTNGAEKERTFGYVTEPRGRITPQIGLSDAFLGIDVGSVSTNLAVISPRGEVIDYIYRRTQGQPINAVQKGLTELAKKLPENICIKGVGTTGSARYLSGVIVGADIVKNEITAHAVAAGHVEPRVRTVLEIGGQDSKIILLKDGIVVDFAMNSVCAAGTGSFLDHQSARLGIPIEEFGDYALQAETGAQIAGRCSVFAESDMIHKQQVGYPLAEIIYGLCQALVRNYLNNLAKGKDILGPLVFQGGVAANSGMKRAFEEALNAEVIVPRYYNVMGAIGAALLAQEKMMLTAAETNFKGFAAAKIDYKTSSFACGGCENNCEIIKIQVEDRVLARWGGRCGKWEVDRARGGQVKV